MAPTLVDDDGRIVTPTIDNDGRLTIPRAVTAASARRVVGKARGVNVPGDDWRFDYHDPGTGRFAAKGTVTPGRLKALLTGNAKARNDVLTELRDKLDGHDGLLNEYARALKMGDKNRAKQLASQLRRLVIDAPPADRDDRNAWDAGSREIAKLLSAAPDRRRRTPAAPEVALPAPPGEGLSAPDRQTAVDSYLASLDPAVAAIADDYGLTLEVIDGNVTDAPELAYLKGVTPRGWPKGKTWDDADGAYRVQSKTAYVTAKARGGTARHEHGHGIDYAIAASTDGDEVKVSDTLQFTAFAKTVRSRDTAAYFKRNDELFAELWAALTNAGDDNASTEHRWAALTGKRGTTPDEREAILDEFRAVIRQFAPEAFPETTTHDTPTPEATTPTPETPTGAPTRLHVAGADLTVGDQLHSTGKALKDDNGTPLPRGIHTIVATEPVTSKDGTIAGQAVTLDGGQHVFVHRDRMLTVDRPTPADTGTQPGPDVVPDDTPAHETKFPGHVAPDMADATPDDVRQQARLDGKVLARIGDANRMRLFATGDIVEANYHDDQYAAVWVQSQYTGTWRKTLVRWDRLDGVGATPGGYNDEQWATPDRIAEAAKLADAPITARIGDARLRRRGLNRFDTIDVTYRDDQYGTYTAPDGKTMLIRWDRLDAVAAGVDVPGEDPATIARRTELADATAAFEQADIDQDALPRTLIPVLEQRVADAQHLADLARSIGDTEAAARWDDVTEAMQNWLDSTRAATNPDPNNPGWDEQYRRVLLRIRDEGRWDKASLTDASQFMRTSAANSNDPEQVANLTELADEYEQRAAFIPDGGYQLGPNLDKLIRKRETAALDNLDDPIAYAAALDALNARTALLSATTLVDLGDGTITPQQTEAVRRWVDGLLEGTRTSWPSTIDISGKDGHITVAVETRKAGSTTPGATFSLDVDVTTRDITPAGNVKQGTADERNIASRIKQHILQDDYVLRKIVLDDTDPRFPGNDDKWTPNAAAMEDVKKATANRDRFVKNHNRRKGNHELVQESRTARAAVLDDVDTTQPIPAITAQVLDGIDAATFTPAGMFTGWDFTLNDEAFTTWRAAIDERWATVAERMDSEWMHPTINHTDPDGTVSQVPATLEQARFNEVMGGIIVDGDPFSEWLVANYTPEQLRDELEAAIRERATDNTYATSADVIPSSGAIRGVGTDNLLKRLATESGFPNPPAYLGQAEGMGDLSTINTPFRIHPDDVSVKELKARLDDAEAILAAIADGRPYRHMLNVDFDGKEVALPGAAWDDPKVAVKDLDPNLMVWAVIAGRNLPALAADADPGTAIAAIREALDGTYTGVDASSNMIGNRVATLLGVDAAKVRPYDIQGLGYARFSPAIDPSVNTLDLLPGEADALDRIKAVGGLLGDNIGSAREAARELATAAGPDAARSRGQALLPELETQIAAIEAEQDTIARGLYKRIARLLDDTYSGDFADRYKDNPRALLAGGLRYNGFIELAVDDDGVIIPGKVAVNTASGTRVTRLKGINETLDEYETLDDKLGPLQRSKNTVNKVLDANLDEAVSTYTTELEQVTPQFIADLAANADRVNGLDRATDVINPESINWATDVASTKVVTEQRRSKSGSVPQPMVEATLTDGRVVYLEIQRTGATVYTLNEDAGTLQTGGWIELPFGSDWGKANIASIQTALNRFNAANDDLMLAFTGRTAVHATLDILDEHDLWERPTNVDDHLIIDTTNPPTAENEATMRRVIASLPKALLDRVGKVTLAGEGSQSGEGGSLAGRSYYSPYNKTVSLAKYADDDAVVHELFHHLEKDPELNRMLFAYYVGRTGDERPTPIFGDDSTEFGREDRFLSHYSGKSYARRQDLRMDRTETNSFEWWTMGAEGALGGGTNDNDEDQRAMVLGALTALFGHRETTAPKRRGPATREARDAKRARLETLATDNDFTYDELAAADRDLRHMRKQSRQAAATFRDGIFGELDQADALTIGRPPPRERTTNPLTGRVTYRRGNRGEWDWWDQLGKAEQGRLQRRWMAPKGEGDQPDQLAARIATHAGIDESEAMQWWLDRTRLHDTADGLARGRIASGTPGNIDAMDTGIPEEGIVPSMFVGVSEDDAVINVARHRRARANTPVNDTGDETVDIDPEEQQWAFDSLGVATRAADDEQPWAMTREAWKAETASLLGQVAAGTDDASVWDRLDVLMPGEWADHEADDAAYDGLVDTARRAGFDNIATGGAPTPATGTEPPYPIAPAATPETITANIDPAYITNELARAAALKDDAPNRLAIRIPPEAIPGIIADGRLKSQHESGTTRGSNDLTKRLDAERLGWGIPDTLPPEQRPVYGFLDDLPGRQDTAQYGDIILHVDPTIAGRSTMTVGDSLYVARKGNVIPIPIDDMPNATETDFANAASGAGRYMEVQFHGGLTLDDLSGELDYQSDNMLPTPSTAGPNDETTLPRGVAALTELVAAHPDKFHTVTFHTPIADRRSGTLDPGDKRRHQFLSDAAQQFAAAHPDLTVRISRAPNDPDYFLTLGTPLPLPETAAPDVTPQAPPTGKVYTAREFTAALGGPDVTAAHNALYTGQGFSDSFHNAIFPDGTDGMSEADQSARYTDVMLSMRGEYSGWLHYTPATRRNHRTVATLFPDRNLDTTPVDLHWDESDETARSDRDDYLPSDQFPDVTLPALAQAQYDSTQAFLRSQGIDPDDEIILFRGIGGPQLDQWVAAGRPTRLGAAPLVSTASWSGLIDDYGTEQVKVKVRAKDIYSVAGSGLRGEVIVMGRDGGLDVTGWRPLTFGAGDDEGWTPITPEALPPAPPGETAGPVATPAAVAL